MADEETAGIPAAFVLGFLNFRPAVSGGVLARTVFRMTYPQLTAECRPSQSFPLNRPSTGPITTALLSRTNVRSVMLFERAVSAA